MELIVGCALLVIAALIGITIETVDRINYKKLRGE